MCMIVICLFHLLGFSLIGLELFSFGGGTVDDSMDAGAGDGSANNAVENVVASDYANLCTFFDVIIPIDLLAWEGSCPINSLDHYLCGKSSSSAIIINFHLIPSSCFYTP